MANKGSVRIIPVDLQDNMLEKRALFLRHKQLPEPRPEFKKYASDYLIGLAVEDLADDVQRLKDEAVAIETAESDKRLDRFTEGDIEAYLARKKGTVADDDSADD
jgi:hypothetical protein